MQNQTGVPADAGAEAVAPARLAILNQATPTVDRSGTDNGSEAAKTPGTKDEGSNADEPNNKNSAATGEKKETKDEGAEPKEERFDKHPAWQRIQRNNAQLKAQNEALRASQETLNSKMDQLTNALNLIAQNQLGDEYKPIEVVESKPAPIDASYVAQQEVEAFAAAQAAKNEPIDEDLQDQLIEIAIENAAVIDGQKVPLTAEQAYSLYTKFYAGAGSGTTSESKNSSQQPPADSSKRKVDTKPDDGSDSSAEHATGRPMLKIRPGATLSEITAAAKANARFYRN